MKVDWQGQVELPKHGKEFISLSCIIRLGDIFLDLRNKDQVVLSQIVLVASNIV